MEIQPLSGKSRTWQVDTGLECDKGTLRWVVTRVEGGAVVVVPGYTLPTKETAERFMARMEEGLTPEQVSCEMMGFKDFQSFADAWNGLVDAFAVGLERKKRGDA